MVWEFVFLMVILKIPIASLGGVFYWAVKAEPKPPEPAVVHAQLPGPEPREPWRPRTRAPRSGPHGSPPPRGATAPAPPPAGGPAASIAGFLAAVSIFASLVGLVYHPVRLIPFAILLALVATAMGGSHARL